MADLDLMLNKDYQEQQITEYLPICGLEEKQEALLKAFPIEEQTTFIHY
ncbi:hypothetical protein AAFF39_05545 [Lactococcus garvieae]